MTDQQSNKRQAEVEKEKGNKYFKSSNYDEAINCYTKAIEYDRTNAILFGNRAMAYHKKGLIFEAEDDCNSALSIDDKYVKAYYRRGLIREQLNRYNLALQDFNKVIQLDSNNKQALQELKKLDQFVKSNKKIKLDPIDKPQRFQSKNPMVKVPINQLKNQLKISDIEIKLPTKVPQTYYQFECDWRELVGDKINELRLNYLKMIGCEKVFKLFSSNVEPQIISDLITVLSNNHNHNDCDFSYKLLTDLVNISRFKTLVLFLSDSDKQALKSIFERLINIYNGNDLLLEKLLNISQQWNIEIEMK